LRRRNDSCGRPHEGKVAGIVGGPDPFESVKEAVGDGNFDGIIISILPARMSEWLRSGAR
jgi:hypothetical protein